MVYLFRSHSLTKKRKSCNTVELEQKDKTNTQKTESHQTNLSAVTLCPVDGDVGLDYCQGNHTDDCVSFHI